jgi:hypothetical protein
VYGIVNARLVRQSELFIATPKIAGINPEGKKNIKVNIDTHIFTGHPLLLELTTTKETSDSILLLDVRQELEDRTGELAAVLTWSLQGAVDIMLGDDMCSRCRFGYPSEWGFDDVVPVEITDYFQDINTVESRFRDTNYRFQKQTDTHRSSAIAAIRWWHRARHMPSALDSFLAYCIIIETVSFEISDKESIGKRFEEAIVTVFPALTKIDGFRTAKKMSKHIYKTRSKCVHSGRGDLSRHQPVYQLAAATAHACIKFLLEGSVSEPPKHILQLLK